MICKQFRTNKDPFIPSVFYSELESLSSEFTKNTQQDCNEFLLSLFNNIDEPSILSEIFRFQIKRVSQCGKCKLPYSLCEPQYILECPVSETNGELSDCLNNYCKKECLTGNNAYFCESCNSKQSRETKMEIFSVPNVLLISLKRFKANGLGKLHSAVAYPELLHIDQWLSEDCLVKITEEQKSYQLFAIVIHVGDDMKDGHYICYVKNEFTNEWYEANDDSFRKIDFVFDKEKSVYLLCYVRSDLSISITADNMKEKRVPAAEPIDNQEIRIADGE
ncbi:unnamed protein product [Rotaria sp. Silwood2]|nr:unnamed protein product [Rotaria sp. Silwood2]